MKAARTKLILDINEHDVELDYGKGDF